MTTPQEPATPVIRILLVDDHEIFLAGLRLLLQREPGLLVIGEARSRLEALQAAPQQPDIILLDLDLGTHSGSDFLPDLLSAADEARVIVLTGLADADLHLRAICLGAVGLVHKLEAPHLLLKAIRKVHAGEVWLNRVMVAGAMTRLQTHQTKADPNAANIASLTAREREVISLIGEGLRNRAIGERLFISEKTVRHYMTSIFSKLLVTDRSELMIYAFQHGLATLPARQCPRTSPQRAISAIAQ